MIIATEMAKHMHRRCHSESLVIVNGRTAGFKEMTGDFLCLTFENLIMLCLQVPSLNSKLEPLRKDRRRKAGQPCVQT